MTLTRRDLIGATLASSALAVALGLSACTGRDTATRLRLASGERGGNYHRFAQLLRDAARHGDTGLAVTPVATNGSAENLEKLASGAAELAMCLADTAEVDPGGSAAIGRIYQNYLQCIVRADGPITAFEDLAGHPISIGAPGSGCSFTVRRLLDTQGQDRRNVDRQNVQEHPIAEALDRLDAGDVDACFWSGGLPTPLIDRRARTSGRRLLDLSNGIEALQRHHPDVYLAARVPSGVYGSTAPLTTVGVPSLLMASPGLADSTVASLVDILIEDAHSLVPQDSIGVQFLTPSDLIDTGTLALHPAARARYRERYG